MRGFSIAQSTGRVPSALYDKITIPQNVKTTNSQTTVRQKSSNAVRVSVTEASGTTSVKDDTVRDNRLPIRRLAEAVAYCEGFYAKGSLAQRQNNPGNIRGPKGFRHYKTVEEGWLALEKVIRHYDKYTLERMLLWYSPPSENDTVKHTACIATKAKIADNVPLKDLLTQ